MKRKFLCLLLTLTLVLGLAATVSASGDRITSGDWIYEIHEGKAVLCSYIGDDTDVVVPAKIDGYAVSELGPDFFCAFGNVQETMKSVTISEGIRRINTNAFKNCTALEQVTVPGSVRTISSSAFEGCTSLSAISFGEGLESIGRYAFLNTGLTSVVLPASVSSIDDYAIGYTGEWGNTEQLDAFGIFGWTDTAAEEYASDWHFTFYRLEDMADASGRCGDDASWRFEASTGTLYIEGEGETDPYYNYAQPWIGYADSIRRVVVGAGISYLGDNFLALNHPNVTEVILPSTLGSIGNGGFRGCTGLTAIELPEDCSFLGGRAFEGCGLRTIVLPGAKDFYGSYLGGSAFANCPDLETVFFAGDAWEFGDEPFRNDTLDAWYPVNNTTWSEDLRQDHGGDITWLAYDPDLFQDVPMDSFYYEPVLWAVENGITTGATGTTFDPNGECLRAHIVTFLWRAAGCPEPTANVNPFADVKETDFYYDAVLWAVENGITTGTGENTFSPFKTCSRAEVVTFLWRAAGKPASTAANPFEDVSGTDFFHTAVLWAVENGITNGMDAAHFAPYAVCNRAQVVTFLYRAKDIEPAAVYTFELRSNDPTEEIGYVYCEGTEFAAGSSVIFTAEPWFGYLVEFEAEPADAQLELYYLGAYTYELIMPAQDVVLTANFVPAQGQAHTITLDCANGFAIAYCDYDEEGNDCAKPGEFVQVIILPEEGYTLTPADISVTAAGQKLENWWYLGALEDDQIGTAHIIELVMPDADVEISITCTPGTETAAADLRVPVSVR